MYSGYGEFELMMHTRMPFLFWNSDCYTVVSFEVRKVELSKLWNYINYSPGGEKKKRSQHWSISLQSCTLSSHLTCVKFLNVMICHSLASQEI